MDFFLECDLLCKNDRFPQSRKCVHVHWELFAEFIPTILRGFHYRWQFPRVALMRFYRDAHKPLRSKPRRGLINANWRDIVA